jgi:hypothetical protein
LARESRGEEVKVVEEDVVEAVERAEMFDGRRGGRGGRGAGEVPDEELAGVERATGFVGRGEDEALPWEGGTWVGVDEGKTEVEEVEHAVEGSILLPTVHHQQTQNGESTRR